MCVMYLLAYKRRDDNEGELVSILILLYLYILQYFKLHIRLIKCINSPEKNTLEGGETCATY